MKRKLIAAMFLLALGGIGERHFDGIVQWWNAPPAAPREEAQRLIASLESADGWHTGKRWQTDNAVTIRKANLTICPAMFHADILADDLDVSSSFTRAERRAINRAGDLCLRKLTARAMQEATPTNPARTMSNNGARLGGE